MVVAGLAVAGVFVARKYATKPVDPHGGGGGVVQKALPASLVVTVTDGDEAQAWLTREGSPPGKIPMQSDLPPGRVSLQVVRKLADGSMRADVVRMTLQSGRTHLVAVGDAPLHAKTKVEGRELDLEARFLPPGIAAIDDHAWKLVVKDPVAGEPAPAVAQPVSLSFGEPKRAAADQWLTAKDQVLVVVNPYAELVECRVEAGDWERELVLRGPSARLVPIGGAKTVKISTRLLPGRERIEERTLEVGAGLPLYSIGGATIYRWVGKQAGKCPPAPEGAFTFYGEDTRLRLPAKEEEQSLVMSQLKDMVTGLIAAISDPPAIAGEAGPLTAQSGVNVAELEPPAALKGKTVSGVVTDGVTLVAIADGIACDFSTGKPLYDPTPIEVSRGVAGRSGLVLLTRTGQIASVKDRKLVTGAPLYDPGLRLAPSNSEKPSVWTYGGVLGGVALAWQTLDGTDRVPYPGSRMVTAIFPLDAHTILYSVGRNIDRAVVSGDNPGTAPVVILPDDGPDVTGIVDVAGHLAFTTRDGVYALQGSLVVPLVEGLGGSLFSFRDGLLVHDARTLRLYHLTGPALENFRKPEDNK